MKPHIFTNKFEHALTYDRPDGRHVEMALIHLPGMDQKDQKIALGVFGPGSELPEQLVELSMEEIEMRLQFFTHLKRSGFFPAL